MTLVNANFIFFVVKKKKKFYDFNIKQNKKVSVLKYYCCHFF